ncbi:TnsA endonuclease N-terminal domain-containing protein [Pelotalea chapellei]|uniref:TnsA endonuclease N-terminal domain-containing protein n=1 Tax=Pelotalea chapellei TaxID=44671 RepID=A0ABS5U4W6_9BACT|nr:TnsA endonuclease N-terminal domain-containing protein [Pelotalea chapellei]MBT1070692.1 TnsA endonuclease N-terminal domain-containing protein [Pelotalea chapellei]
MKTPPSRIIFPALGQLRARKVISVSNHGHVYKFPTIKFIRNMHIDHGLERARATILEMDPDVIIFWEQPFAIEYVDDEGHIRVLYPDFLVFRADGSVIVEEVKPASKAITPENESRFKIEEKVLMQHGFGFAVVTDAVMKSDLRLHNSQKLLRYRRIAVDGVMREKAIDALRKCRLSGLQLMQRVSGLTEELLRALLSQGFISTDLSAAISLESIFEAVRRPRELSEFQQEILPRLPS